METFLMRLQNFAFASKRYGDIYIAAIIISVVAVSITVPLSRVISVIDVPNGSSSAVTIHGPIAPLRQKFLPGANCVVWRCQSRTLPSLKQV